MLYTKEKMLIKFNRSHFISEFSLDIYHLFYLSPIK